MYSLWLVLIGMDCIALSHQVNKQYEELMLDLLHGTCFKGTGLGWTILGPEENIRNLNRQDLSDYIDTHYTG